jgi:NhaA family Na+:H+ antiporter
MTFGFDVRGKLKGALAFVHHEAAGGLVLMVAALAALLACNSPLAWLYDRFLDTPVGIRVGPLALDKPLLLWINEGLMAVFFLLVGLEIKRELLRGELSTLAQAVLPVVAAVGGMAVPATIYAVVNVGDPAALRGWAIPSATDIAFSVGVLALLGSRIPSSLKILLLALAIIDDLGSIVIIALFYTEHLSWSMLAPAAVGVALLWALNARGVMRTAPYVLTGIFIWICVLKSGVHATLAGVVVALAIPLKADTPEQASLLEQLEEGLHPWVAFAVLPLFAFAKARRRQLDPDRGPRRAGRHRLHHEPVHRHAGLPRPGPRRAAATGRAGRLPRLGRRGLSGAAGCQWRRCAGARPLARTLTAYNGAPGKASDPVIAPANGPEPHGLQA